MWKSFLLFRAHSDARRVTSRNTMRERKKGEESERNSGQMRFKKISKSLCSTFLVRNLFRPCAVCTMYWTCDGIKLFALDKNHHILLMSNLIHRTYHATTLWLFNIKANPVAHWIHLHRCHMLLPLLSFDVLIHVENDLSQTEQWSLRLQPLLLLKPKTHSHTHKQIYLQSLCWMVFCFLS